MNFITCYKQEDNREVICSEKGHWVSCRGLGERSLISTAFADCLGVSHETST